MHWILFLKSSVFKNKPTWFHEAYLWSLFSIYFNCASYCRSSVRQSACKLILIDTIVDKYCCLENMTALNTCRHSVTLQTSHSTASANISFWFMKVCRYPWLWTWRFWLRTFSFVVCRMRRSMSFSAAGFPVFSVACLGFCRLAWLRRCGILSHHLYVTDTNHHYMTGDIFTWAWHTHRHHNVLDGHYHHMYMTHYHHMYMTDTIITHTQHTLDLLHGRQRQIYLWHGPQREMNWWHDPQRVVTWSLGLQRDGLATWCTKRDGLVICSPKRDMVHWPVMVRMGLLLLAPLSWVWPPTLTAACRWAGPPPVHCCREARMDVRREADQPLARETVVVVDTSVGGTREDRRIRAAAAVVDPRSSLRTTAVLGRHGDQRSLGRLQQ